MLVLSQSAEVSTFQSHLFPPAQPNSPRLPVPQFGDSHGEGLGVVERRTPPLRPHKRQGWGCKIIY